MVSDTITAWSVVHVVFSQARQQLFKNRCNRFIDGLLIGAHNNLRILGRFVGGIDACEFTNLASPRFFVEMLGSRASQTSSGASTKTSINSALPSSAISRARLRSMR